MGRETRGYDDVERCQVVLVEAVTIVGVASDAVVEMSESGVAMGGGSESESPASKERGEGSETARWYVGVMSCASWRWKVVTIKALLWS